MFYSGFTVPVLRLTLFLALVSGIGCEAPGGGGLNPNERPPDFTLQTLDGESEVTLSQQQGSLTIVTFWASWCAPCIQELKAFKTLEQQAGKQGLQILAIGTADTREALQKTARTLDLPFSVLYDREGVVKDAYRVTGFPETFIVKPSGRLALFFDPGSGPQVRIKGERPWSSPAYISLLNKLLPDRQGT